MATGPYRVLPPDEPGSTPPRGVGVAVALAVMTWGLVLLTGSPLLFIAALVLLAPVVARGLPA